MRSNSEHVIDAFRTPEMAWPGMDRLLCQLLLTS
jgi:hypothetical protein